MARKHTKQAQSGGSSGVRLWTTSTRDSNASESATIQAEGESVSYTEIVYKTYPIRWFGLAVMTLLNMIISWAWLSYAPVASNAAAFFDVDESIVNWLSSVFVFANFAMTPLTIKLLDMGLRHAICTGSALILVGNWIRYAGSRSSSTHSIVAVFVGQALLGTSQSLVLSAPARFSETWFPSSGRVTTTAIMSLSNPMGAAIGQLVIPFWVESPSDVAKAVLYVSIISSAIAIPGFFVPAAPPTPPDRSSNPTELPVRHSLRSMIVSVECFLLIIPFWIFTALFIAFSSLLNQITSPYGFSDSDAGIGGALLIVVGLAGSAVIAPIVDRTKKFLLIIKTGILLGALSYLAFVWVIPLKNLGSLYLLLALLGLTSLSIVSVALEFLCELSHPIGSEILGTIAWAGGQLLGACFTLLGDALKASPEADPPSNMRKYVVFQAILALAILPLLLSLGLFGRGDKVVLKRTQLN